VAAAGLWSDGVGKDQERHASRKSQSGTGGKAAWDGPLIGPGGVPTATSSSDAGEQYAKQRMIAALCDNVVGAK